MLMRHDPRRRRDDIERMRRLPRAWQTVEATLVPRDPVLDGNFTPPSGSPSS